MLTPRILLFIPTYNCANHISKVVGDVAASSLIKYIDKVLVIDNKSQDETPQQALRAIDKAKSPKFLCLQNEENYGLGGTQKLAFKYALENNFDYVAILHGDGQGYIDDFSAVFEVVSNNKNNLDAFLGSRFMKGSRRFGYSRFRTFGNILFNLLFSWITKTRISDLGSGLNLYRTSIFKDQHFNKFPDDLTFNYSMLLWHIREQHKIIFHPISWSEQGQVSNVKLFSQSLNALRVLGQFSFNKNHEPTMWKLPERYDQRHFSELRPSLSLTKYSE